MMRLPFSALLSPNMSDLQEAATQGPAPSIQPPSPASAQPAHTARRPTRAGNPSGKPSGKRFLGKHPAQTARSARPFTPGHPLLEQLAQDLPALFGPRPLPLKRGIFEDIQAAYPQWAEPDLKQALALHTRSNRYLQAVASGQPRHGLDMTVAEATAPEHVFHALVQLYQRRLRRAQQADAAQQEPARQEAAQWLGRRLAHAMAAAPQGPAAFVEAAHTRDAAIAAILEQAAGEVTQRLAREEAMLRAFEASGASVAAFAEMYGMTAAEAGLMLARARLHTPTPQTPANAAGAEPDA